MLNWQYISNDQPPWLPASSRLLAAGGVDLAEPVGTNSFLAQEGELGRTPDYMVENFSAVGWIRMVLRAICL